MDTSRLRLVIFDLDGTILDTLGPTLRCFQEAVAPALGRTPSPAEVMDRFGPADQDIVAAWVGEAEAQAAVARLYDCYSRLMEATGPFPGAVDLVHAVQGTGRRVALFTGRGRPSTDMLLARMGLDGLFEATVTGEEVPHPKPAPDGLLRVLEMLGESAEAAVYVGDTLKDVAAARDAGVAAIGALWGSPEADALATAGIPVAGTIEALRGMLVGE
jgi:AHBA synthesis associated protein